MKTKIISSLEKVFPNLEPEKSQYINKESIFKNEIYSFQLAYTLEMTDGIHKNELVLDIESEIKDLIKVREVGLVPSHFPSFAVYDDNYLTTEPGLFPDVLNNIEGNKFSALTNYWKALWIDVIPTENTKSGTYEINLKIKNKRDNVLSSEIVTVKILEAELPKQKLIRTEWFHTDCISNFYKVEPFSDRYWELIEKFVKVAYDNGVNMILTPIFTPPLDTEVGGERLTVQLIDVYVNDGKYSFDFEKFNKWIDMCKKIGIEYFEISHLFTQWGATSTPKVMATVNGEYKRIFGWETSATADEYKKFMGLFLPELTSVLKELGIESKTYFHISDEPNSWCIETYKKAKEVVKPYLEGFKIIDALSHIELYNDGVVENPIPSNDSIEDFIKAGVDNLWTYYCCAQNTEVSNRFMAMPSARNRIIGTQLFKFNIEGFLHWGYNFWNTQYSKKAINPFEITDAGCAFPSGDSFLVYPGENGPIESIRLKVFNQALYDLRAMELLASMTSNEKVISILEEGLEECITFNNYPKEVDYILNMRCKINDKIAQLLNKE